MNYQVHKICSVLHFRGYILFSWYLHLVMYNFCCQILWIIVLGFLLRDHLDFIAWTFIFCDPAGLRSLKFALSWDSGGLGSQGSWILNFRFIVEFWRSWFLIFGFGVGSWRSWILNFWFVMRPWRSWTRISDFDVGSCRSWILIFYSIVGSCGSWILIFVCGTCLIRA